MTLKKGASTVNTTLFLLSFNHSTHPRKTRANGSLPQFGAATFQNLQNSETPNNIKTNENINSDCCSDRSDPFTE
jgi:hypothetical protein